MLRSFRQGLASVACFSFGASLAAAAEPPGSTSKSPAAPSKAPPSSSTQRPVPGRSGAVKATLPDPLLLDGSTLAVEKRPEQGMVGDFELPGDDNVRNGKVGGPQNQNQNQKQSGVSVNVPGLPQSGGAQGQQGQQGGQQGAQQSSQAGGAQDAQPNGPQGGQSTAGAPAGGADAGAQPGGVQVGGLTGEGADPGAAAKNSKPQQIAIGDSAMRIESTPPVAGVVGSQLPAGPTQQHDKGTGSGGKGAGGSGSNKGVERGRTMPSGL